MALASLSTFAASSVPAAVRQAVKNTRSMQVKQANLGIVVISLRTGRTLYRRNLDHLYTPASVQKLFTATAALGYLKPNYQFQTGFYSRGQIHHHMLNGNLVIKFEGDPSLTLHDLKEMVAELRNMDVQRIRGHVYIDNFGYGRVPYPPGFIWDDLSYSYAAPINAIIINRNKFGVTFKPNAQLGRPPVISTTLPAGVVQFKNNLRTMSRYPGDCPITIYSNNRNEYRVAGCLVQRWGAQSRSLAVRNVEQYAEVVMGNLLRQAHIHYVGKITLKQTPKHATPLVLHDSKSLAYLLKHMLKKSDNVYTNAIFKKLGEAYFGGSASWQKSLVALKRILAAPTGINFKHNLLTDGAGLSRYNLITPHQFMKLLYYAYHNPLIKPALYTALPIAGRDGTLEGRMQQEGRSGRVHAKTGSMTGVSTLVGFVRSRRHGMLGFAIMANGFVGKRGPFIRLEDRICEALANS